MTVKKSYFQLITLLLFLLIHTLPAMAQTNDFENWYGMAISHKLSNGFTALATSDLRFNNNGSRFKKLQADVGAEYKYNKWLKATFCYRYTRYNNYPKYYRNENSFYADFSVDKNISRFNLSYRTRIQETFYHKESLYINQLYSRNKIELEYDIYQSRFLPWVSYELAFRLLDSSAKGTSFDKFRAMIGTKYIFNRSNSLNLFYGLQHSFDEEEDVNSYILGLTYSFKF